MATDRIEPLVPGERIRGVPERIDYKGAILRELDLPATEAAIRHPVEDKGVEALAVCFLWSFYNPEHEQAVRSTIERVAPGTYVSLSCDIAPVPGEYERTSTTVINAYAGKIAADYLHDLQQLLTADGYAGPLLVMQGYGGLLPAEEAVNRAVGMIECGPAAGVIGSRHLGHLMGDENVIAADMGGTTFKVGVIQGGEFDYAREPMVDRFHYVAPKIEVVSIGAGGGSIVSLDPRTNVPRVGPQSAGARPGPVCYGLGGEQPTLTDVMILVGYMDPGSFLGGSMILDVDRTRTVFREKIAEPLALGVEEAAIGIFRIASAQITDLIHQITVERGLDPRDFVLHAFGGSCPLMCSIFGAELNVERIVIPYTAAVNCALGLVSADIVHEFSVTKTLPVPSPAEEINSLFEPMLRRAREQLAEEGFVDGGIALDWSIDLRYGRQVHEVTTPVRGGTPLDQAGLDELVKEFETLYERKFGIGSAYRAAGVEMTMFRLTARGLMPPASAFPRCSRPATNTLARRQRCGTAAILLFLCLGEIKRVRRPSALLPKPLPGLAAPALSPTESTLAARFPIPLGAWLMSKPLRIISPYATCSAASPGIRAGPVSFAVVPAWSTPWSHMTPPMGASTTPSPAREPTFR